MHAGRVCEAEAGALHRDEAAARRQAAKGGTGRSAGDSLSTALSSSATSLRSSRWRLVLGAIPCGKKAPPKPSAKAARLATFLGAAGLREGQMKCGFVLRANPPDVLSS